MIINLVSGPRNVSTALMYSFAQRADTRVWDEPFYAVYLSKTGLPHPGADRVLQALPSDETSVRTSILDSTDRPVRFIKNMAHHMEVLEDPLMARAMNIFLIRDPRQILSSYAQVISRPTMRDIGIAYQYKLFKTLNGYGTDAIVIDSGLLLRNPRAVLSQVCERCGLDYDQRMEHWPAGPKAYDGVWAPYWYANVHRTTGFEKQPTGTRPVPKHLDSLLEEALDFYEKLRPFSLKA